MWCRAPKTVLLVLAAALLVSVSCDIFSSTAHLQNLLYLERHMVTILHDYVEKTEQKIGNVRRYLEDFYKSYDEVLAGNASFSDDMMMENPLQAFQLVKRLSVDWSGLKKEMDGKDWTPLVQLTSTYDGLIPNEDDLHGAALALVRLQETYKLDMEDMGKGMIQGLRSGVGLTARDMLFLGKQSFNEGYYGHSIKWLQQAVDKAKLENNATATIDEITPFLDTAIEVHDGLFERNDVNLIHYDTLGHPVALTNWKKPPGFELQVRAKLGHNNSEYVDQENYLALCRGESLRSAKDESNLHCRLDTFGNPYLFLQPVKTEQMSIEPYIVQFYDLLTDGQVEKLREIAEPRLSRSLVQGTGGSEIVSLSRTSQNAWIGPRDDPLMARVYELVEAITGLSTSVEQEHTEIVQIANYGMGGHYTPHYDYLLVDKTEEELRIVDPRELDVGDRTATLMFYLSDVTRGGATVFPKIGASVWPKKGSAVFWYNLKLNGRENPLTLHGACPVLHGSKWVANFWIREKGQAFRRRCSTNPDL